MKRLGRALSVGLSSRQMRLYWSSDVIGAELGGAVKNVLAIAAGIVEGRGLGASAHAAIVTRGFAELRRFGDAMGARPETLLGPLRARRSHPHLREHAVAQHVARPRIGRGPWAG